MQERRVNAEKSAFGKRQYSKIAANQEKFNATYTPYARITQVFSKKARRAASGAH
jgi:hypothetical protein